MNIFVHRFAYTRASLFLVITLLLPFTLLSQIMSALQFDGVDDYVSVPVLWENSPTELTMEAWIYPTMTDAAEHKIFYHGDNGECQLAINSSQIYTGVHLSNNNWYTTSANFVPNKWYHVVGVWKKGEYLRLFINGELKSSVSLVGLNYDLFDTGTDNLPSLGAYKRAAWVGQECYYKGKIDEVRIWSSARTEIQIRESMHALLTGSYPDLIAYWRLDENSGIVANDGSGHYYHGNLINEVSWTTSVAPVLNATNKTEVISSAGNVMFNGADVQMNFVSSTGTDTIMAIRSLTTPLGTQPTGVARVAPKYWIIKKYGPGTKTANITFALAPGAVSQGDQDTCSRLKLFRRDDTSDEGWTLVASADYATASTVTFENISSFSQFAIGTTGTSTLAGSGASDEAVFQSVASGDWSQPSTWTLLSGINEDGIPDGNDDVIISDGHTITVSSEMSIVNLILFGGRSGNRLNLVSNLNVYGTLNSDDTTLAENIISDAGTLQFLGNSRPLFGPQWSADPLGWNLSIRLGNDQTGTASTHIRAGDIQILGGTFQVGTWEQPRDLRADKGSPNTGTISVNIQGYGGGYGQLVVTGNISRTATLTDKIESFTAYTYLWLGGTTISANSVTFGHPWYYLTLKVMSPTGISIPVGITPYYWKLEYIGTSPQLTGSELTGTINELVINNPAGVTLANSVSVSALKLQSGDVTVASGLSLSMNSVYGGTNAIKGDGDAYLNGYCEIAHQNGMNGLFQNNGTLSLHPDNQYRFNGTAPQSTGTRLPQTVKYFYSTNPTSTAFSQSTAVYILYLEKGTLAIMSPESLTIAGSLSQVDSTSISGTGNVIQTGGTLSVEHPAGFDGAFQNSGSLNVLYGVTVSFAGKENQTTGLRFLDSAYYVQKNTQKGLTLNRSTKIFYLHLNSGDAPFAILNGVTLEVATQLIVTAPQYITGAGNFTLSKGAYAQIPNTGGTGEVLQLSGAISFANNNYVYFNGPTPQTTGTVLPDTIGTFIVGSAGLTLNKATNVSTLLQLDGSLDNSAHNIKLLNNALIRRGGAFSATPLFGDTVNLEYSAWNTTGFEIPPSPTVINALSVPSNYPLTLGSDVTVHGYLQTSGVVLNGDKRQYTLKVLGTMPYGLVFGRLTHPVTATGEKRWNVGYWYYIDAAYLPCDLNIYSFDSPGYVTVEVADTSEKPLPSLEGIEKVVARYYKISQTGLGSFNTSLKLRYADADVYKAGIAADDSLKVFKWDGAQWAEQKIVERNTSENFVVVDSVQSFSDYIFAGSSRRGIATLARHSIEFGNVRLGTSKKDSIYIKNTGTYALTFSGYASNHSYFTVSTTVASLALGDSGWFVITFYPQRIQREEGMIIFYHNGVGERDTLFVGGNGVYPSFALSRRNVNFGSVRFGESKTDTVHVFNSGTGMLSVSSITSTNDEFSITPATTIVPPSDSVQFSVTFTPKKNGTNKGALVFNHDAYAIPETLFVVGAGVEAIFAATPTEVNFNQVLRGTSKKDTVTVQNTGTSTLYIHSVTSTNPQFTAVLEGDTLEPTVTKNCIITYTPSSAGLAEGSLIFVHNGETTPDSVEVTGTGIEPVFATTPSHIGFGTVQVNASKTDTIHIKNTGAATLHISDARSSDTSQFSVSVTSTTLQPNEGGFALVTFNPKSIGDKSGFVEFFHDAFTSPDTVTLSGKGATPVFTIMPTQLNFGNLLVGSSKIDTVTVTNTGEALLIISSAEPSDTSNFDATPSSVEVQPSASQKFIVTFKPKSIGAKSTQLVFTHNGLTSPNNIPLQGIGTEPSFAVHPDSINVGDVRLGKQKSDSVEISNLGTATLQVYSIVSTNDTHFKVNPVSGSLGISGKLNVSITFIPTVAQVESSLIIFTHSARTSPDSIKVIGRGVEPLFAASPKTLAFDSVLAVTEKFLFLKVKNPGTADLNISSVLWQNSAYRVTPESAVVAPKDSLLFTVTFKPTRMGIYNDRIIFGHDARTSPDTVFLNGIGTEPLFAASPKSITFGSVLVGREESANVKVKNIGTADLNISSIAVQSAAFKVVPANAIVKPNDSTMFTVIFKPTSGGVIADSLIFNHNALATPDTIFVKGKGLQVTTIAQARALPNGTEVVVDGIITRALGTLVRMQDTSAALTIRQTSGAFYDSVATGGLKMGDSIRVVGRTSEFSFMKQINTVDLLSFERLARGKPLPPYQKVTLAEIAANGEKYESELIEITAVSMVSTTDTAFKAATTYTIRDKSDSSNAVTLRIGNAIDTDTDGKSVPKATFTFKGVLTQYSTDPATGYQLLPILATDIVADPSIVDERLAGVPMHYILEQNYPNPFNPSTTIKYGLPSRSNVRIEVFNMLGQKLATLFEGEQNAGYHLVHWHTGIASGIYFYRIEATDVSSNSKRFMQVKKMMLLR